MDIKQLETALNEKLAKPFVASSLLCRMRLLDEAYRKTAAYSDPRFIPFYYHLGGLIKPRNLLQIGFGSGVFASCLLRSCDSVKRVLAFQEQGEEFYSPRLGRSNVRDYYKGELYIHVGSTQDDEFCKIFGSEKWDLTIITEETGYDKSAAYLDLVWPQMEFNGLVVMDYLTRHTPASQAFFDFCKGKSREPVTLKTRYGVGMVQK
jgi:hypothetical protein